MAAPALERLAFNVPIDTPALVVDLDAVDRNIHRMQTYCDDHGLDFRPHVKTHKLTQVAKLQLAAGAVGIACQKLGEAAVMASAGIHDILVTFPLVGELKLHKLSEPTHRATISTVGDSAEVAHALSAALGPQGLTVGFLVECDTGLARTGVQTPNDAVALAELVDSLPGLRFDGFMTHPTTRASGPWLRAAKTETEGRGLLVAKVSGGGTPTAFQTHMIGTVTEVRAGTYVFGDRACLANGTMQLADCAARVVATVVSRPTKERAILDAGSKALTTDPVYGSDLAGHGLIVEYPQARIVTLSEEHGHVDVFNCERQPEIGEVVTVIPNHVCACVNLYDDVFVHRRGHVETQWRVAARGRSR